MKTELVAVQDEPTEAACGETDSSQHKSDCQHRSQSLSPKPAKKRIGPFSFYLHDVIGRGFSSVVYRGIRDNDKSKPVALKVIALDGMSSHRRLLLENQVRILKMLNNPNIVSLLDIYYTPHNCYIVMEYCEGGSLQTRIDSRLSLHWPTAALQVGLACRYLSEMKIMHRDIKPANVFLKGDVYKLGDFGFAHTLADFQETLEEKYLIGSPLYMPPEALISNTYSLKGDAFAFGILLYYLVTHHFPWRGKDKHELIEQYERRGASQRHLNSLPPKFKHFLNGLLDRNMESRLSIVQLDLEAFRRVRRIVAIQEQLLRIGACYEYQIKLCQFIHFLMVNYERQVEGNHFLLPLMSKHLGQLVEVFGWHRHPYMGQLKSHYRLPQGEFQFSCDHYHWLNNCLKDALSTLYSNSIEPFSSGLMLKLLQYQLLVQRIMYGQTQEISALIQTLTLHESFSLLRPSQQEVRVLLSRVDFYQL